MLVMAGFCVNASAQFFVGGTAGFSYRQETFSMTLLPQVGYEFNETWAVGCGAGVNLVDDNVKALVNPYLRFNFWNNEKVFLDLKATSEMSFSKNYSNNFVGLRPSIRYAVNDHLQLSTDIGFLGCDIYKYKGADPQIKAALGLSIADVQLTVLYRL